MVSALAVTGLASAYSTQLREVGVNNSATINATFGNFNPSNPPPQIQGSYNVLAGYYQLQINGRAPSVVSVSILPGHRQAARHTT
jgi:hypothetical protein